MRTLPQAPNLDYIKQQAKDLLAALRETEPGTTLSGAQRALAEQYGFRTWTDLRAEVERRRSESQTVDTELADSIAKAFDLGEPTTPGLVLNTEEVMGPELQVETESGRWYAHAVLDWVTDDHVEDAVRLMDAARGAGIITHKPVRSSEGRLVEEAGGARWRVDEWMDLGPVLAKPSPISNLRKIATVVGTLHRLGLPTTRRIDHPWLTQRRTPESWRGVVAMVEESGAPLASALEDALPAILDISSVAVDPPEEGLILSHANLSGGLIRRGRAGALVVLGWEFSGPTTPAWDLAPMLHGAAEGFDKPAAEARVRAFAESYTAVTGSWPPLDLGAFSAMITAWLNWLARQIGIAHHGDPAARERTTKEVLQLLAAPPKRERLERVLRIAEDAR